MTDPQAKASLRLLYRLTIAFGTIGFVSYSALRGVRTGFAFLLGAAISFGNLWLFDYLSRSLAASTQENKPWSARAFISRYLLLFAGGYAITKLLAANPLAVVWGLLTSTVALLVASIAELLHLLPAKWNKNSG